jgi:hypothetical protein
MKQLQITKVFYDDHYDRFRYGSGPDSHDGPPIIKETKVHYFVDITHPDMEKLISDAIWYWSEYRDGGYSHLKGLCLSARALIRAYKKSDYEFKPEWILLTPEYKGA